jgi:hypothetical protein
MKWAHASATIVVRRGGLPYDLVQFNQWLRRIMDAVDVMCKGCGKCVECGWQIGEFGTKEDSFRCEASAAMVVQGSPAKWRDVTAVRNQQCLCGSYKIRVETRNAGFAGCKSSYKNTLFRGCAAPIGLVYSISSARGIVVVCLQGRK